jgi:YbbR domain-containing protein
MIPIEFTRLPRGLALASQSDARVQVQIRGRSWLLDSVNLDSMTARLDLAPLQAGSHTLVVAPEQVRAPPGVSVVNIAPRQITVRLDRQEPPKSR